MVITMFSPTGSSATTVGNSIVAAGSAGLVVVTVMATAYVTTVIARLTIHTGSSRVGRTPEGVPPTV